jgi:hypothetical protein
MRASDGSSDIAGLSETGKSMDRIDMIFRMKQGKSLLVAMIQS